jgi:hypothetical protein
MFKWLKRLFSGSVTSTGKPVVTESVTSVEEPAKEALKEVYEADKPKKKTKAKKETVDLDSMTKKDLLALAKERGIKANASLKKAEIIERLK